MQNLQTRQPTVQSLIKKWATVAKKVPSVPPHLLVFKPSDLLPYKALLEIGKKGLKKKSKHSDPAEVEALMLALKELIRKAAIQQYTKPELITAIKATLHGYEDLQNTIEAVAIVLFIFRTVERDCAYCIDTEEVRRWWQ
jgi:hypothetical protein